MAPPWYLDTATGDFGPLETGLTDRETGLLVSAPPVPAGQSAALAREYRDRILHISLPLPPVPERQRIDGERPTPLLRLASAELVDDPRQVGLGTDWYADDARDPDGEDLVSIDYALLLLDYGGTMISPDSDGQRVERVVDGRVVEIGRDLDAEREAIETLEELGFDESLDLAGVEGLALVADDEDWIDFMRNQLPRLREAGWRIGIAEDFAFRITPAGDLQLDIDEPDGGRWLDIALGIDIDGERQDLLPVLLELLQDPDTDLTPARLAEAGDDAEQPVRLADGRLILLPVGRLRPILSALVELYDPDARLRPGGRLRLSRLRAGELAALEEANSELRWQGGDAARDWARRLAALGQTERVAPPAGLDAELRAYQHDGLDWLQGLRALDLGGILADDMGLGKTIQTLAHLLLEKASGRTDRPSLVVAPTSLMFNWTREAARFTPDLRVLLLHGPRRSRSADAIASADLVLTTYALLPRDLELLSGQRWHVLILDEAQAIKNPRAKAAQAARALDARQRLCLTGTPLENHLGELWALLDFLLPDLLGDERRFRRLFRTPIERQGDAERAELLRRRIAPFLLRRTKEQVAAELPPKTEIPREVPLARDQRDLYETLRLSLHEQVQAEIARKGLAQSGIVILDALLKLRQCCCDPRLVSLPSAARVKGSAKLDLLMELLPELLDEGRQVLLFSQFTGMLKLIEEALAERLDRREGRDYVKLTGRTRDRATPVDRFQAGEVPLFLISLKAGGAGLNLTAADTVIHYDPWWNPAAERQATDRAHRIGQDKPVFVYKLLTEGTVEQRVAELQARKQTLADAMLAGGGSAAGALSADDLALLLAPLD
jgi:superfamily II DNA or RNA helicase